jgi:hypothetical protein
VSAPILSLAKGSGHRRALSESSGERRGAQCRREAGRPGPGACAGVAAPAQWTGA